MCRLFVCIFVALCSVATAFAQNRPKTLRIGWDSYPPMQMLVANQLQGIDVDIAANVIQGAGYRPVFVQAPWARQLSSLEHGDLDVVMGASVTEDRKVYAVWTSPYRSERASLLKLSSTVANPASLTVLLGQKAQVGMIRGSEFGGEMEKLQTDPRFHELVVSTLTMQNSLDMLRHRRFPFVLDDPDVFLYFAQSQKGEKVVEVAQLYSGDVRFMVGKKALQQFPGVLEELDRSLSRLKNGNGLERIYVRYGLKR